ncbi:MAG: CopG family ribbon-helix-helix protein [Solirubrobacterales bacterium]
MGMRIHINLDDELVRNIDEVAGPRGRSRLIREAVEQEVDRRRRRKALEEGMGSVPGFAPHMTAEWISAERKRQTRERDEKIEKYWRRD